MINYEIAFLIAILGFVYTNLLTEPEMILNPLYNWIQCKLTSACHVSWWRKALFKIIIHCEKCFSGQFAFWFYLITEFKSYSFIEHVFFVAFTIFIVSIVKNLYTKTQ